MRPLSTHIGTSSGLLSPSPATTPSVGIALCGVNSMSALGDLIFSGALENHPNCKIALSEGGAGRAPYVLERLDYTWLRTRYEGVNCSRLPSDRFADHFWVCMIADRYAIINRDLIVLNKVMWECDFPHNDSNWARQPQGSRRRSARHPRRGCASDRRAQRPPPLRPW